MRLEIGLVCAALMVGGKAHAQQAVQWPVELGGNGHWYATLTSEQAISWTVARDLARDAGGHLATLTSEAENAWVFENVASAIELWNGPQGPYLGASRDVAANCGAGCGWSWITGEPWGYTAWDSANPSGGTEAFLHFGNVDGCWCPAARWNDIDNLNGNWPIRALVVEWSADCNNDGIVDYGQVLSGALVDFNSNGIPDVCELSSCPGDVTSDGVVDGVDLAAVLGAWGTDGQGEFFTDVNFDGIVDGADLAYVLSSWGVCPG